MTSLLLQFKGKSDAIVHCRQNTMNTALKASLNRQFYAGDTQICVLLDSITFDDVGLTVWMAAYKPFINPTKTEFVRLCTVKKRVRDHLRPPFWRRTFRRRTSLRSLLYFYIVFHFRIFIISHFYVNKDCFHPSSYHFSRHYFKTSFSTLNK